MFKTMLLLKKKKYAAIKLERDAQGNPIEVRFFSHTALLPSVSRC